MIPFDNRGTCEVRRTPWWGTLWRIFGDADAAPIYSAETWPEPCARVLPSHFFFEFLGLAPFDAF
jgi:hypothetical protein